MSKKEVNSLEVIDAEIKRHEHRAVTAVKRKDREDGKAKSAYLKEIRKRMFPDAR